MPNKKSEEVDPLTDGPDTKPSTSTVTDLPEGEEVDPLTDQRPVPVVEEEPKE